MALRTPTNGKTSDPENRVWAWGLLGSVLMPVGLSLGVVGVSLGALAGMIIGGITGRAKRDEELKTGFKNVRKPSYINGGMAKGYMWGNVVGALSGFAVGGIIMMATGGTAGLAAGAAYLFGTAAVAAPAGFGYAAIGIAVTYLATKITMTVKGSIARRAEMAADYHEALAYQNSPEQENTRAQQEGIGKEAPTQQTDIARGSDKDYQFDNSEMANKRADRPWTQDPNVQPAANRERTTAR